MTDCFIYYCELGFLSVRTIILINMLCLSDIFSVLWHFDTRQNSNQGSSACSHGFMTLKNTGAHSLIYICAVWSSLRPPKEDNRSLPGSSINRQSPKQAINIPSSPWPWPADHSVYTEVKGGSMVALSISACRDLGMFSCPVLVWEQDTVFLCSCRACWSSVAKLMSFWKQLIKGSRCGRWAISLNGDAGCPLPSLAGGWAPPSTW